MKQTKSSISLCNGDYFDFLKPEKSTYDIDTIATSLSYLCRYTGHVTRFYSVAEHSVLVSLCVPKEYALEGLLHDASEAFLGDVSSPLKKLLDRYQEIEYNVTKDMAKRFNLSFPFPDCIHQADKELYWLEREKIAPQKDTLWHQEYKNVEKKVVPMGLDPYEAKVAFLARYREIMYGRDEQILRQRAT